MINSTIIGILNVLLNKNYAWANPKGAFNIWITLPPEIVAKKL